MRTDIVCFIYSGYWTHYDSNIEKACSSFTQIYFRPVLKGKLVVYKNVFCLACNSGPEFEIPTLCRNLRRGSGRHPFGSTSFSAIVNFKKLNGMTTKVSMVERPHCSMAEIYDEYMVGFSLG